MDAQKCRKMPQRQMPARTGRAMNPAILLMGVYLVTVVIGQAIGFGISRVVNEFAPAAGLLTFLVLFIAMFWLAWPVAVYLTEPKKSAGPQPG